MFRTRAFRDVSINGHVIDPAFREGPLGYGDDLDLAWRMALLGWRQVLVPDAIGWHDRSTTHDVAGRARDHVGRIAARRAMPIEKRMLDWVNVRAARIKNDRTRDVVRDLPFILVRELSVLVYMLVVEPAHWLVSRDSHAWFHRCCDSAGSCRSGPGPTCGPGSDDGRRQGTKRPRKIRTEIPSRAALETASAAGYRSRGFLVRIAAPMMTGNADIE